MATGGSAQEWFDSLDFADKLWWVLVAIGVTDSNVLNAISHPEHRMDAAYAAYLAAEEEDRLAEEAERAAH